MPGVDLLFALAAIGFGLYLVLAAFLPDLRWENFGPWSVNDGGSYIEFFGIEKTLRPPKVIAEGEMSERAAAVFSFCIGFLMTAIGCVAYRHITGIPAVLPDLVEKLFS
jgi:hypothetical protein